MQDLWLWGPGAITPWQSCPDDPRTLGVIHRHCSEVPDASAGSREHVGY